MLRRAASNAYSWWWASHIRTKQSKWLDNNLQEMEEKVDSMLKIIDEDADSFAKRAEMYYKKRPELINFVEEAYRAYRALAERYDRISGELHKANHTIATAFPDQVQFGLEDEDDDGSPNAKVSIDSTKINKPPPEVPQIPQFSLRNKSKESQAAPKKPKHRRITSQISKDKAQEEIDRIQKAILFLQTEKEFFKSSYQSGLAKYWEIEKKIMEMQEEVCSLQDQFNASAVIEDDEARAVMATSALKSCEDALVSLQEQQKKSSEEARMESKRIKNAKKKLWSLKGEGEGDQLQMKTKEISEDHTPADCVVEEEVHNLKVEKIQLQLVQEKVKEHFEINSETSVVEIAEKIDGLVEKIISLELTASSQMAQIDRLRTETDKIQQDLQSLEEEKLTLIVDSNSLTERLKKAEEDLEKVQDLEKCVRDEKGILHTNFIKACHSLNDLSETLLSPNHKDQVENGATFEERERSLLEAGLHLDSEAVEIGYTKESLLAEAHGNQKPNLCMENNVESSTSLQFVNDDKSVIEESLGVQDTSLCAEDRVNSLKLGTGSQLEHDSEELKGSLREVTNAKPGTYLETDSQVFDVPEKKFLSDQAGREESMNKEPQMTRDTNPFLDEKEAPVLSEASSELENVSKNIEDLKYKDNKGENIHLPSEEEAQHGEQVDTLNLQQLMLNGLEDREKVLLAEYTSILRSFKDTKKRLSEVERKSQESLSETMTQIRELKSANATKDEEIRLLRQRLSLVKEIPDDNADAKLLRKLESFTSSRKLKAQNSVLKSSEISVDSANSESKKAASGIAESESPLAVEGLVHFNEPHSGSAVEEKFRRDIDAVLEENLEFWLRFSTSFHNVQKFQTKFEELQAEIKKLKDSKSHEGSSNGSSSSAEQSVKPASAPIDRQLRELKTDLQVWLEQNATLRGELNQRFSSLCNIQEEISTALSEAAESGELEFIPYQAAKFQGEVLNMQQENNKVATELQAGLDHVKGLQGEVERALWKLQESSELSGTRSSHHPYHFRNLSSKTRIPLRNFLFGVKPKKPSIFACMNPALQKQYSDLRSGFPT